MESNEDQMRDAVRLLADALETMLNLIHAGALPRTAEAHRLLDEAMLVNDESIDRVPDPDNPGETLQRAMVINQLVNAAREKILDDTVAAFPVPDHPEL